MIDYDQPTFNVIPEPSGQYAMALLDKQPEDWGFPAAIEAELAKRVNGPLRESSK